MENIKICVVMPFYYKEKMGGAEIQSWLMAKEMVDRGYEVHYLVQSISGKKNIEKIDNIIVHWRKYYRYLDLFGAINILRKMNVIKPKLIIQRMTSKMTGILAVYSKMNKIPFAWICTDNTIPFKWACVKNIKGNRIKGLLSIVKYPILICNNIFNDILINYGIKSATYVFCQNDFQYNAIRKNYNVIPKYIYSGHEIPQNSNNPENRLKERIILWVGSIKKIKRPELFVELASENIESNFKFVIIGGRKDDNYLHSIIDDLPKNITYLGNMSFDDHLAWFDRAFILVNTSESEGFSNTFIQAWLRGIPLIALNEIPNETIVNSGLGYNVKTLNEISEIIKKLLDYPNNYYSLSYKIERNAQKIFNIKKTIELFLIELQLPLTT